MISNKQVMSTELYSKLCLCPGKEHRENCTANIPMDAVIGNEGRYLKQAVDQVSSGGRPPVSAITIVHGGLSYCILVILSVCQG